MWLIAGTVPENGFPFYTGGIWEDSKVEGDMLVLPNGKKLPVARGATALAATAIMASQALGKPVPRLLLVGDCGTGKGSDEAYTWLSENLPSIAEKAGLEGLTFHYFYPDLDGHNRVFMALEDLKPKPMLVADAGFMYVAKMSGYATSYDLFAPDIGELAFLADEMAPHPFYTRGFLLAEEEDVPELLKRARSHDNCPFNMIVKGKTDYILCNGELYAKVSEPSVEAMECIGGTGDIVTGFATAFLAAGYPICKSALQAARAARYLALFCNPNPETQAAELIDNIGKMLRQNMELIQKE